MPELQSIINDPNAQPARSKGTEKMKVLVIAAHGDDEILGCGGTIARHVAEGDQVHVLIMASNGNERAVAQAIIAGECAKLMRYKIHYGGFNDQQLDSVKFSQIVERIEYFSAQIKPKIVYTHWEGDLNLDHQIVSRAVKTAFRPLPDSTVGGLYEFEVLSSTEWGNEAFKPNHFVQLSYHAYSTKLRALSLYEGEMRNPPHPRSHRGVEALSRLRGMQVGVNMAEAFRVVYQVL